MYIYTPKLRDIKNTNNNAPTTNIAFITFAFGFTIILNVKESNVTAIIK